MEDQTKRLEKGESPSNLTRPPSILRMLEKGPKIHTNFTAAKNLVPCHNAGDFFGFTVLDNRESDPANIRSKG
jgi:hypothetical protein